MQLLGNSGAASPKKKDRMTEPGLMAVPVIPDSGGSKHQASLGSLVRPCLKGKIKRAGEVAQWWSTPRVGRTFLLIDERITSHRTSMVYSALKRKDILTPETIWEKLEDSMLREVHLNRTSAVGFHSAEVPRVVGFIDRGGRGFRG